MSKKRHIIWVVLFSAPLLRKRIMQFACHVVVMSLCACRAQAHESFIKPLVHQLFLDSVHNKKRRKKVLTDAELLARKRLKSLGAEGRTRWEILLQEDILAKYVDEYLGKVGISFGIACGIRVMNWVLDPEGLVASLTTNLIITLRCLAVVTFFIKDDLLMPNN